MGHILCGPSCHVTIVPSPPVRDPTGRPAPHGHPDASGFLLWRQIHERPLAEGVCPQEAALPSLLLLEPMVTNLAAPNSQMCCVTGFPRGCSSGASGTLVSFPASGGRGCPTPSSKPAMAAPSDLCVEPRPL